MAGITPERLRKWADELDAEEKAELDAAEKKRIDELAAQPRLSPEDVEWVQRMKADLESETSGEPEPDEEPEAAVEEEKPRKKAKAKTDEPPKRTRPGRKTGAVYGFHVDEAGQVQKLDIGRVYSGPDEPDEVEVPDPPPADDGEADAA